MVYSIPCTLYPAVYIGQTSRTLRTRIKEHKAAVKCARTEVSAVAEHVWQKKHQLDFQRTCVLTPNLHQYCFLESWHIQKQHLLASLECSPRPIFQLTLQLAIISFISSLLTPFSLCLRYARYARTCGITPYACHSILKWQHSLLCSGWNRKASTHIIMRNRLEQLERLV